MHADLLIKNAAQLVTPFQDEKEGWGGLRTIENAAVACLNGSIVKVGSSDEVLKQIDLDDDTEVFDATGKTVLSGFVDAHTHPVFAATREGEFRMRIAGKSYQEIAAAGGGIRSSVRNLRKTGKEQLIEQALPRLDQFLANGTTTIEAKSGYGLSLEDEIKMLEVMRELNRHHPVKLIPTFLGAHEVPDEYRNNRERYIRLIIDEMLPRVAEQKLAVFCDVFCEESVFSIDEARKVLTAAAELGMLPKLHVDQLTAGGGAQLAAEVGAISADHLDHIDDEGIRALVENGVVPVLLPGAVFFLNLNTYAPARAMIDAGLPVAIATDFNPGSCPSLSMPMMMSLACLKMGMTPDEALVASTANAALAVGENERIGKLQEGWSADITIWDVPNYEIIPYHFGMNLVSTVIINGKTVWREGRACY